MRLKINTNPPPTYPKPPAPPAPPKVSNGYLDDKHEELKELLKTLIKEVRDINRKLEEKFND